jgi:flagellar basal-body rod protein FlgB
MAPPAMTGLNCSQDSADEDLQVSAVFPVIYCLEITEAFHNPSTGDSKLVRGKESGSRKSRCFMFANLTSDLDFHSKALVLRAERQRVIASNIANADTPGYIARDVNFKEALAQSTQMGSGELASKKLPSVESSTTNPKHLALPGLSDSQLTSASNLAYAAQTQPSVDGNSVDLDRERANFVDNSVRYESTLRFINGQSKTILSAIQGQ